MEFCRRPEIVGVLLACEQALNFALNALRDFPYPVMIAFCCFRYAILLLFYRAGFFFFPERGFFLGGGVSCGRSFSECAAIRFSQSSELAFFQTHF